MTIDQSLVEFYIARVEALTRELDKAEQEAIQVHALRQDADCWQRIAYRLAEECGAQDRLRSLFAQERAEVLRLRGTT